MFMYHKVNFGRMLLGLVILIFPELLSAQSHYPGQHEGKFSVGDQFIPAVYSFNLSDVKLLDSRFTESLFIPSVLTWKEKGFTLKQETDFPKNEQMRFTIIQDSSAPVVLKLRYPGWAVSGVTVKVNRKMMNVNQKEGSYISIAQKWKKGDLVEVDYPMSLHTHTVPTNDDPNQVAFAYSPMPLQKMSRGIKLTR